MRFRKVIILGHTTPANTMYYVFGAFVKAFRHLGYDTIWADGVAAVDFGPDCLYLTEGQVDQNIPIRRDCTYVLHNCDGRKYPHAHSITLQVYTDDVLHRIVERINAYTFWGAKGKTLYQPWGCDLLPHEIRPVNIGGTNTVHWVGTIGKGEFGNFDEIEGLRQGCIEAGLGFVHREGVSSEDYRRLIQISRIAPTVVGTWQQKQGYLPCRLFKHLSFNQYGITNSPRAQAIFDGRLIFNTDTRQLVHDALAHAEKQDRGALMRLVQERHTFINRIEQILRVL